MVPEEIEELPTKLVDSFRRRQVNENLLHRLSETLRSAVAVIKNEALRQPMEDRLVSLYHFMFKLREQLVTIGDEHITELQCRELEEVINEMEEHLAAFDDRHNHDAADPISSATNFDLWEKTRLIGSGGCGIVHVGLNKNTGELCAIKEMLDIDNPKHAQALHKEIQVLRRLKHQNIVKYYGSKRVGSKIYLYMEYVQPGSMKKYIRTRGALEESLVRHFTKQFLFGLTYLHCQRVVHRDIKPDNLLVDSQNNVKLADFGLAKHLANSVGNHSVDGTMYYTAPEVIEKKEYNSSVEASAADIWSLGCLVIEMFTGRRPWSDCTNHLQVIYKVCFVNQDPAIPESLSPEGKDFLRSCFMRDPAKRPSAETLLSHPFMKTQFDDQQNLEAADPISSSMNFNPWEKKQRIGSGKYGIVYAALNRETEESCAIKEILDIDDLQTVKSLHQQIRVLSRLEHRNIVKYYGCKRVARQIFIYMEYVQPGSLKKYISTRGALQESLVRNFTAQILSGLAYLHSLRVVHRDVKADHILVDSENTVKLLIAFGLTKDVAESVGNRSLLGTPYYPAPEFESSSETGAADIWSLGCVVIEMFTGNLPWPVFNPAMPDKLSKLGKNFLKLCFRRDPAQRPSAAALLNHPFVKIRNTSLKKPIAEEA